MWMVRTPVQFSARSWKANARQVKSLICVMNDILFQTGHVRWVKFRWIFKVREIIDNCDSISIFANDKQRCVERMIELDDANRTLIIEGLEINMVILSEYNYTCNQYYQCYQYYQYYLDKKFIRTEKKISSI